MVIAFAIMGYAISTRVDLSSNRSSIQKPAATEQNQTPRVEQYQAPAATQSQGTRGYRQAVREVMARYNQIADQQDPKIIREVLINIDTSRCPDDFRQAHLAVIEAISEFVAYHQANVPKNAFEGAVVGAINNVSGRDVDGGFTRLRQGIEEREGAVVTATARLKALANSY
jgi:hypothetical protein